MADSHTDSAAGTPTDSPWFWMATFCAAGLVILLVAWPKYSQRQARLELKYRAGQEITRRNVEREAPARPLGQEGDERPPQPGELIITLWPIAAILVALFIVSTGMFWRSRRAAPSVSSQTPRGAT